ncbi:MAG: carbohydrate kinase, partial [Acidobacteriota bacterium]|nr:carbohydrate kinase [Acidobacteriota bacterium]
MIVVTGEALIDLIPTATGDLGVHPGGGPFNTARWLGRLGAEVAFLESIAADPLGQRLRDELVAAGVALDLLVPTALPTTLALVQLDAAGVAQYAFYPDTSMADVWPEQVEALLPSVALEALYLGSIGLVLEPAASAGVRAVQLARARGAVVMVDPNIRASLIADRAVYLARLDAVLAQTDVLKLSVDDLAWLAPGEPPLAAARRWLDHGPRAVLLTGGALGATVLTDAGAEEIPAVAVEVVDTIGAGDAFSAGLLTWWWEAGRPALEHASLVAAAAFAVQVAAATC